MIAFKVDTADVILDDLGDGRGKIIISDGNWGYNFSYYWGAMGDSLIDFLSRINSSYFVGKLGPTEKGEINTKKTMRNIRKAIREEFNSVYPWYTYKEFQTELRYELKNMEGDGFYSNENFSYSIERFLDNLSYYSIDDKYDRKEIESLIRDIFNEHWYYIVYDEHRENVYLEKFHKKLVKTLKSKKLITKKIETVC
jgi:superoxide dismutase